MNVDVYKKMVWEGGIGNGHFSHFPVLGCIIVGDFILIPFPTEQNIRFVCPFLPLQNINTSPIHCHLFHTFHISNHDGCYKFFGAKIKSYNL